MGRFETAWLTSEANLAALAHLPGAWIERVHARRSQTTIVLDMDSSVSEMHGIQEGSAYNGHFGCTCYHPLFVFNQFGDLERCALRPGSVHTADGWRELLQPVITRYRHKVNALAYNLANFLRTLALPEAVKHCSGPSSARSQPYGRYHRPDVEDRRRA